MCTHVPGQKTTDKARMSPNWPIDARAHSPRRPFLSISDLVSSLRSSEFVHSAPPFCHCFHPRQRQQTMAKKETITIDLVSLLEIGIVCRRRFSAFCDAIAPIKWHIIEKLKATNHFGGAVNANNRSIVSNGGGRRAATRHDRR